MSTDLLRVTHVVCMYTLLNLQTDMTVAKHTEHGSKYYLGIHSQIDTPKRWY